METLQGAGVSPRISPVKDAMEQLADSVKSLAEVRVVLSEKLVPILSSLGEDKLNPSGKYPDERVRTTPSLAGAIRDLTEMIALETAAIRDIITRLEI